MTGRPARRGRIAAAGAVAGLAGAVWWWRQDTAPFPYAQHRLLDVPLPLLGPRRLTALLEPRPGQQLLEIGPGTGLQALHVAPLLGPEGRLHVVDVQPEMLAHVVRRTPRASRPSRRTTPTPGRCRCPTPRSTPPTWSPRSGKSPTAPACSPRWRGCCVRAAVWWWASSSTATTCR